MEKSENLDNAVRLFLRFFEMTLQKTRFWILKKKRKNVFSNYEEVTCQLLIDTKIDDLG